MFFCVDDAAEFLRFRNFTRIHPLPRKPTHSGFLRIAQNFWLKDDKFRLKKHVEGEIAKQEQLKASKTYQLIRAAV